jgi:succinyl-CoA synthetase beta subunit
MKLYEYETKKILSILGVQVPNGQRARTGLQIKETIVKIKLPVAVKAQILVAGRGKAGGILFATSAEEAQEAGEKLLQSEIKGVPVREVLVEERVSIRRELYFGVTVDRNHRCYVVIASKLGGVNLEEKSGENSQSLFKLRIDPQIGFRGFHARLLAKELGYAGDQATELAQIMMRIYEAGVDYDAELVESNPLVETIEEDFVAVDARLILDDNALFRHPYYLNKQLKSQRDLSAQEFEAFKSNLNYVKLEGDIGVVGNGAGLVMATMDMISLFGGRPANFLDMGGGAPLERIEKAFSIILSDPKVNVVFVNILGGITLCDEVARSIVFAKENSKTQKALVVRLVGTNEREGRSILTENGLSVFDSMEEAARRAVELAAKGEFFGDSD